MEEEIKKRVEEERKRAEEELKKRVEEERKRAEEELKKRVEEERKRAEEELKKRIEEERKRVEEDIKKRVKKRVEEELIKLELEYHEKFQDDVLKRVTDKQSEVLLREREKTMEKLEEIFSRESFVVKLKELIEEGEEKKEGKSIDNLLVDELYLGYFNLLGFSLPDDEVIEVIDKIFDYGITVIRQMSGTGKTYLCRKIHFLNNLRFYLEDPRSNKLLLNKVSNEISKVARILEKKDFVDRVKETLVLYSICSESTDINGSSRYFSEVDFGFKQLLVEIKKKTRKVYRNFVEPNDKSINYIDNNFSIFNMISKYVLSVLLFYHVAKRGGDKAIDSRKMINGNTKLIEAAYKEIQKIEVDIFTVSTIMKKMFPSTKNFVFIFDEAQVLTTEAYIPYYFSSFRHEKRSVIAPIVMYNQLLNDQLQGDGITIEFVFSGTNVTSELDLMVGSWVGSSLIKTTYPKTKVESTETFGLCFNVYDVFN